MLGRSKGDKIPTTALGWARLFRLHALLIVFIATFACSQLVNIPFRESVYLAIITVLGLAAGNSSNDVADREADAKTPHKSWRPIPSGVVHPYSAMNISYFLFGMIVIIALTLSYYVFVVTCLYVGLLFLYNWKARQKWGLYGHVVAALLTTSCVTLPMTYAVDFSLYPLAFGLFLLEVGREIIVSVPDLDEGVNTLPRQIGEVKALKLSYFYTVGWLAIFPMALLTNHSLGIIYFIAGLIWAVGLFTAPKYARVERARQHTIFQICSKGPMVIFVLALLLEVYL